MGGFDSQVLYGSVTVELVEALSWGIRNTFQIGTNPFSAAGKLNEIGVWY